jgi:hypothetical protein
MLLLVGDNPFHGISHLSQKRSRERGITLDRTDCAAQLVATSLENGADGFMFSVSETTLSILENLRERKTENLKLFALVPYAYEYVRLATQVGGISGLAKKMIKEIILSKNIHALYTGVKGVGRTDLAALLKTYVSYEVSRIRSSAGAQMDLNCVLLHELITEMILALDLDWIVTSYIEFMLKNEITPGFETRNFAYLVKKFEEWDVDFRRVIIASPFNKLGFQMNPSRLDCEKALSRLPVPNVIAISILAAGHVKTSEAAEYVKNLPNLKGIVVGVSKEQHARETFVTLKERIGLNK